METVIKFLIDRKKKYLPIPLPPREKDLKFDSEDEIVDSELRNGIIKVCGGCFMIFNRMDLLENYVCFVIKINNLNIYNKYYKCTEQR